MDASGITAYFVANKVHDKVRVTAGREKPMLEPGAAALALADAVSKNLRAPTAMQVRELSYWCYVP